MSDEQGAKGRAIKDRLTLTLNDYSDLAAAADNSGSIPGKSDPPGVKSPSFSKIR